MNRRSLELARHARALRVEAAARLLADAMRAEQSERQHAEHQELVEQAEMRAWHACPGDVVDSRPTAWCAAAVEARIGRHRALRGAEQATSPARDRMRQAVSEHEVVTRVLSRLLARQRDRMLQREQDERDEAGRARHCAARKPGFAGGWPTV